jgi:hypothetical protein
VETGRPFRAAYREVSAALRNGKRFASPSAGQIVSRRRTTGNLADLGLSEARARIRAARSWNVRQCRHFEKALRKLAGRTAPLSRHPPGSPRR